MYGIEQEYCNSMIIALIQANRTMLETHLHEAITQSHVPLKEDTLGIDQRPENTIAAELKDFDQYSVLITEEKGEDANPLAITPPLISVQGARTFYICDPCDRSSPFQDFLEKQKANHALVGDVLLGKNVVKEWEKRHSGPATITGCNAAITCVRRGLPICSVILNYITQELIVACSSGIYHVKIPRSTKSRFDLDYVRKQGRLLRFPQPMGSRQRQLVTFLGKPEKGYPQNFYSTKLVAEQDMDRYIYYKQPGGPTRILYLSHLQPNSKSIGFIVANGEKIGEWIHWLPFIRFAQHDEDRSMPALRVFEVTQSKSFMRDGYLLTPSSAYSVFTVVPETTNQQVVLDVNRLRQLSNPSKYRATLIVTPACNRWAIDRIEQYGYREFIFHRG